MKLNRVKIKNFRSIEGIEVKFDPSCRVLVGINESGKTNILRALSMISKSVVPTKEDIREPLPNEKSIEASYVEFIFKLDQGEIKDIYDNIKDGFLTKDINKPILKSKKGTQLSLKEFCNLRNEGLFNIDIKTQKKTPQYWELDENYIVTGNWKKPNQNCPAELMIEKKGEQIKVADCALINTGDYQVDEKYLEDVEPEYINELVGGKITEFIGDNLPDVIWWEYKEENLLQPSVNIDTFAATPDTNIPLKNMFALAGIEAANIQKEINDAKTKSANSLRNLLRRVANHTTKHFHSIWKEYEDIKFTLEPNANNVDAGVEEKNFWNVRQRSDGFKRFVTFQLLISAQERTKSLKDTLLLIDEPDVSLHPTGARYLRDELIKISKNNYVVYSTHSIFMIDRKKLERHIKVKKEGEKTNIETANESNIFDEEVLYNAIGASVFEVLKEKNIIFEGWRDKKLFDTAISKLPAKNKELKKFFNSFGLCHAQGVKDVNRITPMLELADRQCVIISDADNIAKEKQREYQDSRGYGEWKRYDEISPTLSIITGEDFVKKVKFDSVIKQIKSELSIGNDPDISTEKGRIYGLRKWLSEAKITSNEHDSIIKRVKESVFDDLKISDIEEKYFEFLESLKSSLENKRKV